MTQKRLHLQEKRYRKGRGVGGREKNESAISLVGGGGMEKRKDRKTLKSRSEVKWGTGEEERQEKVKK